MLSANEFSKQRARLNAGATRRSLTHFVMEAVSVPKRTTAEAA
jgi:hypothetical protein